MDRHSRFESMLLLPLKSMRVVIILFSFCAASAAFAQATDAIDIVVDNSFAAADLIKIKLTYKVNGGTNEHTAAFLLNTVANTGAVTVKDKKILFVSLKPIVGSANVKAKSSRFRQGGKDILRFTLSKPAGGGGAAQVAGAQCDYDTPDISQDPDEPVDIESCDIIEY